jgi:hypothetical protein
MENPKYGDILMFDQDTAFGKLQHFLTRKWIRGISPKSFGPGNRSHSAICAGVVCGEVSLLSAKEKVVVTPWKNDSGSPHRIYRVNAPDYIVGGAANSIFNKDTNQWYGFFWLPYFAYRFLMEIWFHKDVRKTRPWFPAGVICSEEVWLYFLMLAVAMKWQDLIDYLNEWNGNNFHSSDTQSVLDAFPQYFALIDAYNL